MPGYHGASFNKPSQYDALISSLGPETPDAFYFSCAFGTIEDIKAQKCTTQKHLNLGLKAAYTAGRADVGKYLGRRGAECKPLVAFVGEAAAQDYLGVPMSASWSSDREKNDLRLEWASLLPKNRTVVIAVEGFDEPAPSILHLQASSLSMPPDQRIAWMRFDLERSTSGSNLNRIAYSGNIQGTPLHWAVDDHNKPWENRDVLTFLLEQRADPRITDGLNKIPKEYVQEMLAIPEGEISSEMREFYSFALDVVSFS